MNAKYRYLPSLNSYFLQKQAFEQHRKNINTIKRSNSSSRLKIKTDISEQNIKDSRAELPPKYSIHSIKE